MLTCAEHMEPTHDGTRPTPSELTVEQFLAFYDTRPDEEQWQLVDGVALLMTPPFLLHQVIATNLQDLLNTALKEQGSRRKAVQRAGVELLPQFPHYRPEPDVAVIDLGFPANRRYVDRFYLVAEVLSSTDEDRIDLKRQFYRAHEHNRNILVIRQDAFEVELDRREDGGWVTDLLRGREAVLQLSDFGLTCSLDEVYRDTPMGAVGPQAI